MKRRLKFTDPSQQSLPRVFRGKISKFFRISFCNTLMNNSGQLFFDVLIDFLKLKRLQLLMITNLKWCYIHHAPSLLVLLA